MSTERRRKHAWLIAGVVLFLTGGAGLLWVAVPDRDRRRAEERLAEINAARAVPPQENAAEIYESLAVSYPPPYGPSDPNTTRAVIAGLLEASKRSACYFRLEPTLSAYREQHQRLSVMRSWATLLFDAAQEDMTMGHFDAAVEKSLALRQIGQHLQQQPTYISLLTGLGVEGAAWKSLRDCAMHDGIPQTALEAMAAIPIRFDENWAELSRPAREVQPVFTATYRPEFDRWVRSQYGFREWATVRWREFTAEPSFEEMTGPYYRMLALRRGVRILVGLRLYYHAHGYWPTSVERIRGSVPEDALVDPFTGQPFVYRKTNVDFCLYSRGSNRIDDNGLSGRDGPDDWPIWPPRERNSEAEQQRQ